MGKEAKIGLAVVGTLTIVFCGVLYKRVSKLRTTPAVVAKSESKSNVKSGLFGSPNKLATVAAKDGETADPSSAPESSSKWSDNSPVAASKAAESAPPRASYLPTDDESTAESEGRYASRPSQTGETASDADAATEGNAPATEDVANDAAVDPEPTSAPIAISNRFARSAPEVESDDVPEASVTPDTDDVARDEASAPARFDEDSAAPAAAIADAAPPQEDVRSQPTSRFITPPDDEHVATPAARYGTAAPRTPLAQQARDSRAIAGGKYKLGPNENFWTVSEKAYGNGGYFKALHAFNAENHPVADDLNVGDEIAVPMKSELEQQFPDLCPKPGRRPTSKSYAVQASAKMPPDGSSYVVQEGDTLFDIARYELGKASRWAELYELNRDVIGDDIDFLRAGMELVLPDERGKADSMTRKPGGEMQR